MDVIKKITQLIALTKSDNENESRNAAALACRLILEHKIVLQEPAGEAPRRGTGNVVYAVDFDDLFDGMSDIFERERAKAEQRRSTGGFGGSRTRPKPAAAPPPPARPPPTRPQREPLLIQLQMSASCCGCGYPLEPLQVVYAAQTGYWHVHCWKAQHGR